MSRYWIEIDDVPRPSSLSEWAAAYGDGDPDARVIARAIIGDVHISTVFLSVDHNFGGGQPILYESMVFGGQLNHEQQRYHTRAEALAGHLALVQRVMAADPPSNAWVRSF